MLSLYSSSDFLPALLKLLMLLSRVFYLYSSIGAVPGLLFAAFLLLGMNFGLSVGGYSDFGGCSLKRLTGVSG